MPVLSAGFIIEEVAEYFFEKGHLPLLEQLAHLSSFKLVSHSDFSQGEAPTSMFAVASNIISRGVPTRSTLYLADQVFQAIFDDTYQEIEGEKVIYRLPTNQLEEIKNGMPRENILELLEGRLSEEKKLLAQLLLTPMAVARIQKVLLQLIIMQVMSLESNIWNILIIERDVPCATLAVEDLRQLLGHLLQLEGEKRKLPKINLSVVKSEEFADTPLGQLTPHPIPILDNSTLSQKFDAVLDISLKRESFFHIPKVLKTSPIFEIRTSTPTSVQNQEIVTLELSELVTYPSLGQQTPTKQFSFQQSANQQALQYLLENIFRTVQIPAGVPHILNRALQRQSLIAWYPGDINRLQAIILSALLQPGMTAIVYEGLLQGEQDLALLSANYIETAILYSHLDDETDFTQKPQRLAAGSIQFLLTTVEQLYHTRFRSMMTSLAPGSVHISQLIFQEAHAISEWAHHINYLYASVISEVDAIFQLEAHTPKHIFSGTMTYDVIMDICASFSVSEDSVIEFPDEIYQNKFITYSIIPVPYSESQALLNNKQKSLVMVKYPVLKRLISNVPFEFGKKHGDIFGPISQNGHAKYPFGCIIYDQHVTYPAINQLEALSKYLVSEQYLDIGTYSSDFISIQQSNEEIHRQFDQLKEFRQGHFNVLITNYDSGDPIKASHARYTIHYHLPLSPEHLYEETAFALVEREKCNAYILYHPLDLGINESKLNLRLGQTKRDKTNRDTKVQRILNEFLEGISYPDDFLIHYLSHQLSEKLGLNTRVKMIQEQNGVFQLMIESAPSRKLSYAQSYIYGSIYLPELVMDFQSSRQVSQGEATKVLNTAISLLEDLCPEGNFEEMILQKRGPGIASLIRSDSQDIHKLVIGHQNEYLQRLTDLIKTEGNYEIDLPFIHQLVSQCMQVGQFIEFLEREYPLKIKRELHELRLIEKNTTHQMDTIWVAKRLKQLSSIPDEVTLSGQAREALEVFYPRVRTRQDTLQILHRLKQCGIIERYDWNESGGFAVLHIRKQPFSYYTDQLRSMLSRNLGPVSVKKWLQGIPVPEADSDYEIRAVCELYMDYIYNYIAPRKVNATRYVAEMCREGQKKGSTIVHEYMKQYFLELFAHRDYLPSETRNNQEPMGILDKYAQFITSPPEKLDLGSEIAILKHIKRSCESVQVLLPRENRILNVIRAFTGLLLYSNSESKASIDDFREQLTSAQIQFVEGISSLKDTYTDDQWLEIIDRMKSHAVSFNEELAEVFDEIANTLMISYYRAWLSAFNSKFFDITN